MTAGLASAPELLQLVLVKFQVTDGLDSGLWIPDDVDLRFGNLAVEDAKGGEGDHDGINILNSIKEIPWYLTKG